jgi:hypothetical protein
MFGGMVGVALQVRKTEDKEYRSRQDSNNCDQKKEKALKPTRVFFKILELRAQVRYWRSAVCHL